MKNYTLKTKLHTDQSQKDYSAVEMKVDFSNELNLFFIK